MKFDESVVKKATIRAAKQLKEALGDQFYLAGGTALALRYGHRVSLDLDLFSMENRLESADRERILEALRALGPIEVLESTDGSLHLVMDETSISLLRYSYPLLDPVDSWRGLPIAGDKDIAAMKLSAVLGRGTKKDFIDVFLLSKKRGLKNVLKWGEEKFSDHSNFILQAARSLVFFDDAEKDPLPRMKMDTKWDEIKRFFEKNIPRVIKGL